jgi:hypothetical protein
MTVPIARRKFIVALGGAATWPLVARAQQGDRVRRIGVLMLGDETDPVRNSFVSAFTQALAGLGWTDGRNVRMDLRWVGVDINRMRALARELVGSHPTSSWRTVPRRPLPSNGRRRRSRSSLRTWRPRRQRPGAAA